MNDTAGAQEHLCATDHNIALVYYNSIEELYLHICLNFGQ